MSSAEPATREEWHGAWRRIRELRRSRDVEGLIGELRNPIAKSPASPPGRFMEWFVRRVAAQQGEEAGTQGEVGIGQLVEGGLTIRATAARALGKLGDARAVEPLAMLLDDPDAGSRMAAAIALGRVGGRNTIPALLRTLGDPSRPVRIHALASLVRVGAPDAVPPLIAHLESRSVTMRRWAARRLGRVGDERAVAPLRAARGRDRPWWWWRYSSASRAVRRRRSANH